MDNLFKVMECPYIYQCEYTVTTMEWKLNPRQGFKRKRKYKGKQNTRLELDETEMFMFELVKKSKKNWIYAGSTTLNPLG